MEPKRSKRREKGNPDEARLEIGCFCRVFAQYLSSFAQNISIQRLRVASWWQNRYDDRRNHKNRRNHKTEEITKHISEIIESGEIRCAITEDFI